MRKNLVFVVLGLGAALLVAAVVAVTWAPGVVKKTPIDVNTDTFLEGTAARIDTETGELTEPRPIKIFSNTRVDSEASDDEVAVFVSTQCVAFTDEGDAPDCPDPGTEDDPNPQVLSISIDKFATDRVTGEAVNEAKYLPEDAVPHEGLVNKFPFDTEKKDYQYWDGLTGRAWPAVFAAEEEVEGVDTYRFDVTIEDAPIEVAEDTPGTYSNTVNVWVEPRTGGIQRVKQSQGRFLEDGTQALQLDADYTADQLKVSADDASANISSLNLVLRIIPIVGFALGGVLLALGVALLLLGRRNAARDADGQAPGSRKAVSV